MANRSGMLDSRKQGNFVPKKEFNESKFVNTEAKEEKNKKPKAKSSFNQQKKNVKVSTDIKTELEIVKRMNHLKFDYEAVQFLIDKYLDTETESNKRTFKELKKIL